jgi:hypothetical protein
MPERRTISPVKARLRARTAGLGNGGYPPDHAKVVEAKRDLKMVNVEEYITKALAEAPPLTSDQRDRLAELLRPVRKGGHA